MARFEPLNFRPHAAAVSGTVFMMRPGSKNAKEIRIDATTGEILNVQTERPEDQAEEPPKTH